MVRPPEIRALLDRLAKQFEDDERTSDDGERGWGQFLDDPRQINQIGPYGTAAGLIVSALAARQAESLAGRLSHQVNSWWSQWKDGSGDGHRLLCQNLRLAMFYLALKTSHVLDSTGATAEVKEELLKRMLPERLWGDYWLSPTDRDATPRLFCSSIVIIVLRLFEKQDAELQKLLEGPAEVLEDRLLGTPDLPVLHAAAAATAILAVKGPSTSSKVRRRIRMLSLSGQGSLGDLGVYFYDYKYSPDQKNRRDYFIVPAQLMLGIAGYQDSAPAALRVRAESVATALHKSMSANGGVYLTEPQQRTSTKNQAWAAILLSLALTNPKLSRLGSRIWYGIRRERRPTWLTESVLPLLVLFLSISASVYFRDEGRWINTLTTVNVFFWSSVYGRVWVDRVFLGR